jgi:hypothetical protein
LIWPHFPDQTNASDKSPEAIPQKSSKSYQLLSKFNDDGKKRRSKRPNANLAISIGDTQQNDARHEKESFDSEFVMNLMSSEHEA